MSGKRFPAPRLLQAHTKPSQGCVEYRSRSYCTGEKEEVNWEGSDTAVNSKKGKVKNGSKNSIMNEICMDMSTTILRHINGALRRRLCRSRSRRGYSPPEPESVLSGVGSAVAVAGEGTLRPYIDSNLVEKSHAKPMNIKNTEMGFFLFRTILSVFLSIASVPAVMVTRARNPVHSVLFLIPVFRNTSGLLIVLGLDFFAMISLVVYVGAIAVPFPFVVMMSNIRMAEIHENVLRYLPVGGIIGPISRPEISVILDNDYILSPTISSTYLRYTVYAVKMQSWTNLETLGNLLHTRYSVWFLMSGLIPLVAMIGAIVLTRHKTIGVERQEVVQQNARNFHGTIRRIRRNEPKPIGTLLKADKEKQLC